MLPSPWNRRMDAVDAGIFQAWLASTDDGVVAVDAEGRVVLHNPAASRVTGLAPSAAHRRPWREVLRLDPAAGELLWTAKISGRPTSALASVLCRTRGDPGGRPGYGGLVGADPAMTALYDLIEAIAPSDAPVVIEGEAGVGKELVAQTIHARSHRAERPLIAVDCGAVSPSLLEAELFGRLRPGPHGTASLGRPSWRTAGRSCSSGWARRRTRLRRGSSGCWRPAWWSAMARPRPAGVDLRIITATTRPLDLEVREGRFRDDLRRRLQVVRIRVPALRERRGDIALLGEHFLARNGAPRTRLSTAAASVLQACEWPGNVRQIESVMREVAAGVPPGVETQIEPHQLREGFLASRNGTAATAHDGSEDRRTLLLRALSSHGGNRTAAARALGIGRATFYRWWREAGLGA